MYIKTCYKFKILETHSTFVDRIFESIFIELILKNNTKIIIGSVYRPNTPHPNLSSTDQFSNFLDILSNTSNSLNDLNVSTYICGDFNLDVLKYSEISKVCDYVDIMFSFGFLQIITKPTRCTSNSATLIDHIFSNNSNFLKMGSVWAL